MNMRKIVYAGGCFLAVQGAQGSQDPNHPVVSLNPEQMEQDVSSPIQANPNNEQQKEKLSLLEEHYFKKLENRLDDLNRRVNEKLQFFEKEIRDMSDRFNAVGKYLESKNQEVANLSRKIQNVSEKNETLTERIVRLEKQNQQLLQEKQQQSRSIQEQTEIYQKFEKRHIEFMETSSQKYRELQKLVNSLSTKTDKLENHTGSHCERLDSLDIKSKESESNASKNKTDIKTLEETIQKMIKGIQNIGGTIAENFGRPDQNE